MFDEIPKDLKGMAAFVWDELGSITSHKEFEKNLQYADDSSIEEKSKGDVQWYIGQCKDGKPHGFGRKITRGNIYEGFFENGEKDGWGRLICASGTYYIGYFQDDMFHGDGKLHVSLENFAAQWNEEVEGVNLNNPKNYTVQEGEFQLGTLVSNQFDNYYACQQKIERATQLKEQYEEQINHSSIEKILEEIRSIMLPRGGKAFGALIRQFQSTDEGNSRLVDYEQFKVSIGYFKAFHLSDSQVKKLFNHYSESKGKKVNYMKLAKAIAGQPKKNRVSQAKELLSNLASKQKSYLSQKKKQKKANQDPSLKSAPIYDQPKLGTSLDMKNFIYKFVAKRLAIKNKDEFIKYYKEHQLILDMIEFCEVMNSVSIATKVISVDSAVEFFNYQSVTNQDDGSFNKELAKMKLILEDCLTDDPEVQFIADDISTIQLIELNATNICYLKAIRSNALK